MKNCICFLLALVMCALAPATALADDGDASPQSDVFRYYENRNKTLARTYGNSGAELTIGLYNANWAYASGYLMQQGNSFTAALDVIKLAFPLSRSNLLGGGGLTLSVAATNSVTTQFTADSSRQSNIGMYREYRYYTVDTYYVANYGTSKTESFCGTSTVKEPYNAYYKVIYYDEYTRYLNSGGK